MGSDVTAGQVVQAYVTTELERLVGTVSGLRAGDDSAVHAARVSTRRLRTALSVYRPVLDRTVTDPLRGELADLGRVLGAARDAHVEREELLRELATQDPVLVVGPIVQRVDEDRSAARMLAFDLLESWLASERFGALVDGLSTSLPPGPRADRDSLTTLPRRVRRAWFRLDEAVATARAAEVAGDRDAHDEALHEVRKAARRARYASEVAAVSVGKPARRSARRAHDVHDVLGAQHDAVRRRETLRRLAIQAEADGESTFTYGRLHALAEVRANELSLDANLDIDRALDRRHRRWMR